MQHHSRSVSLLLVAEFAVLEFGAIVYLSDSFIGLGPDGRLTGILVLAFLVLATALLVALPPLVWLSTRSLLGAKDTRTTLAVCATVVGVCIWLLVAAWLIFVGGSTGP